MRTTGLCSYAPPSRYTHNTKGKVQTANLEVSCEGGSALTRCPLVLDKEKDTKKGNKNRNKNKKS